MDFKPFTQTDKYKEFLKRQKQQDETQEMDMIDIVGPAHRKPEVKLYNIHKRTLPVRKPNPIDQIVVFRVPLEEAEMLVRTKLETVCYQDDTSNSKTMVYYEILPVDCTPKERNVYFNTGVYTKDGGTDTSYKYRKKDKDVEWKG